MKSVDWPWRTTVLHSNLWRRHRGGLKILTIEIDVTFDRGYS